MRFNCFIYAALIWLPLAISSTAHADPAQYHACMAGKIPLYDQYNSNCYSADNGQCNDILGLNHCLLANEMWIDQWRVYCCERAGYSTELNAGLSLSESCLLSRCRLIVTTEHDSCLRACERLGPRGDFVDCLGRCRSEVNIGYYRCRNPY